MGGRGEPWNFANWPAEFFKIFSGKMWALLVVIFSAGEAVSGADEAGKVGSALKLQFLRATAVPAGTAEARISYGDSVCLSVRPSQPGVEPSPGEIETSGLHHMVAWSI